MSSAVAQQGGDTEHRAIHVVFAFCTSQFGNDPGSGAAMRQVASSLAQSYLVPGDSFSVAAWEMKVWDWQGPFPVSGRSAEEKTAQIVPHLPQTHEAGSTSGHDLEQSLVNVQSHVDSNASSLASSTVDIFLTPTEASIDAPGQKAIGENAPPYLAATNVLVRCKAVQIHFEEEKIGGEGNWLPRQIDAVVFLPKSFQGAMLTGGTRSNLLLPVVSPEPPHRSWLLYVLAGIVLVALVATIAKLIGRGLNIQPTKAFRVVRIADRQISLEGVPDGNTWRLVGPKFPGLTGQDINIGKESELIPPVQLGEMALRNKNVILTVFGDSSYFLRGGIQSREIALSKGTNDVELAGEYARNPSLPPQSFRTEIAIAVE